MTDSTHPVCSTSNCDNRATVKVADTAEPMLVCGQCWHGMMMVETVTIMSEADRAAARKLVRDWCDPKAPKGWEMTEPGYLVADGKTFDDTFARFEYWVDVRDGKLRKGMAALPLAVIDVALRSVIAGMAPTLAGTITAALDDGDALRGVIARAIEASNSIEDRDAEDAIQEMLQHLLEAEPEGHDDRIEWARMEGANAMLEAILQEGYGARGISDNRDALRRKAAELAVASTVPRNPEPEFENGLLQREVEQLRAELAERDRWRSRCPVIADDVRDAEIIDADALSVLVARGWTFGTHLVSAGGGRNVEWTDLKNPDGDPVCSLSHEPIEIVFAIRREAERAGCPQHDIFDEMRKAASLRIGRGGA